VQYINKRLRRSGTLWEGRHKASVVDADSYYLLIVRPFHRMHDLPFTQLGGTCFCWLRILTRQHIMFLTRHSSQQKSLVS